MSKISYVIPCYQNELNIPVTFPELKRTQARFPSGTEFEYIFVDDGSKDQTYNELLKCQRTDPQHVAVVKLASNVGSHTAIFAGLRYATGDCHVILAADLQDPPELVPNMFKHWQDGFKLVIGHRSDREESRTRKIVANIFHGLFKRFALKQVPEQGFDLLLFDRKLTDSLLEMNESGLHVPYALFSFGYQFVSIPYVRRKRELGESQWTLSKKVKLFVDSFVGFSYAPIRMISILGMFLSAVSMIYLVAVLIHRFLGTNDVPGWSSLMVVVLLVSSFQFLALGILGEYLWRTLDTVRTRPRYVVENYLAPKSNI